MILKDILDKKSADVLTINQDETADLAVKIMAENKVSDVLIVDETGKLVGIFTERDVVRYIYDNVCIEKTPIKTLMTKQITTFEPSTEISSAIQIVAKEKIRHLPVVEGDKIVGMITYRDLVAYVLPEVIYMAESIY